MDVKRILVILALVLTAVVLVGAYVSDRPDAVEAISQKWGRSTHSDSSATAFTNWDEDDPPAIPVGCAKCHSTYGFLDFLGEDGTEAGVVDAPARTGSVILCNACHNEAAHEMTQVTFPSGDTITEVGKEAVCMQCHQGTRSNTQVNDALSGRDLDTVDEELAFINVHYAIAAATLMGGEARGGYQYEGRTYVGRLEHVPDWRNCADCHDPHSQAITPNACSPCHVSVTRNGGLRAIRTDPVDYDGDGNVEEGIRAEIETLEQELYQALQSYTSSVVGSPIVYADRYPYFFVDADADGEVGEADSSYASWTPRLVRAAYNYHFVQEDSGNYVHNPDYILQLLYDSLADLAEQAPVEMEGYVRPGTPETEGGTAQ